MTTPARCKLASACAMTTSIGTWAAACRVFSLRSPRLGGAKAPGGLLARLTAVWCGEHHRRRLGSDGLLPAQKIVPGFDPPAKYHPRGDLPHCLVGTLPPPRQMLSRLLGC